MGKRIFFFRSINRVWLCHVTSTSIRPAPTTRTFRWKSAKEHGQKCRVGQHRVVSVTFFRWTLVLVIWQAFTLLSWSILKVYTHICGITAHARMLGWLALSNICVCSWKMLRGGQRGLNQWLRETLSEPMSFQVIKRIQTFDNSCSCLTCTIFQCLNNLCCVAMF